MESRLIALGLTLDDLGVSRKIDSFNDRKRFQKAVYLTQVGAVDFGYRYGWYLKGPYSPALAEDYFQLATEDEAPILANRLQDEVLKRLAAVAPLMSPPEDVDLVQEDWLELLASVHFLRKVRGYDEPQAREVIQTSKTHVAHHFDVATSVLAGAGLL